MSKKENCKALFDKLASSYDDASQRFFPFCADAMAALLKPKPGQKILDVATGTGALAIAAAQSLRQDGRVIGIDLSEAMIDKAIANVEKMALRNVDFFVMDGETLEFKSDYFDHVACSFGLFFFEDMAGALNSWKRVCKPGGSIMFSSFAPGVFEPIRGLFVDSLRESGLELPQPVFSSDRLSDEELCRHLLSAAGLEIIGIHKRQFGYHLASADQWWDLLWNTGSRALLEKMDPKLQHVFKINHLKQVESLAQEQGIWLDVPVLISQAVVP